MEKYFQRRQFRPELVQHSWLRALGQLHRVQVGLDRLWQLPAGLQAGAAPATEATLNHVLVVSPSKGGQNTAVVLKRVEAP